MSTSRRDLVYQYICAREKPVTGAELAREFAVSRQVIVQDIALLRATGCSIAATPEGYICPSAAAMTQMVVACCHNTPEEMRTELYAIVDCGATVLDVTVEHAVYGEIRGNLNLASRLQVDRFMDTLIRSGAEPLARLTQGVHLHTIIAPSGTELEQVRQVLMAQGLLVEAEDGAAFTGKEK